MPIPIMGLEDSFHFFDLLTVLVWIVPFAGIYIWHILHDHKQNHNLIKKLDEILELLKKNREE